MRTQITYLGCDLSFFDIADRPAPLDSESVTVVSLSTPSLSRRSGERVKDRIRSGVAVLPGMMGDAPSTLRFVSKPDSLTLTLFRKRERGLEEPLRVQFFLF